jgi:threonine dehydratase
MIQPPSLLDLYSARRRLATWLPRSPLRPSPWLSTIAGAEVHLKIESVLPAHSFKIRGAFNAALGVIERGEASRTIVTASAGNHGRALALAGERLGLRIVVFTPQAAPATKKQAIRRHGARLDDTPPDYDAAEAAAREFAGREGAIFISPYNHEDVIAGAGTIGLEILEALPDVARVYVPIGGGGLASGVAMAIKAASPAASVIGVEADASTPFATGFADGRITEIVVKPSVADGLTGNLEPDAVTFALVRQYVDRLLSVSEPALHEAVRALAGEEHLIVEGAGAAATAALLTDRTVPAGAPVVVLVTGGNIDLDRFATIVR